MKSGTTSLFEILSQHPEIAASSVKESDFFSEPAVWTKGLDWYLNLWDHWDPTRHRVALEASPSYATFPARPRVPERMKSIPDADFRLVYLLRNPLTQIPSAVRHTLYGGWGRTVDEGIPEWMVDNVRYAMQVDRFLDVFSRDQLLLLTLEEFQREPRIVLERICRFVGVDDTFSFQQVTQRYNSGEVYELPPFWTRVLKLGPLRKAAYRILPRRQRHQLRALLPRFVGRSESLGRYKLTDEEKAELLEQLADDLHRLESTYEVPVREHWSLPTTITERSE